MGQKHSHPVLRRQGSVKKPGERRVPVQPVKELTQPTISASLSRGGMGTLLSRARRFWYNNEPGPFPLGDASITRGEFYTYGGPDPGLNPCEICQEAEWLSRVRQSNLFVSHDCETSRRCQALCQRQGDELWTHYHQNFWFEIGRDLRLNAPCGLFYFPEESQAQLWFTYWNNCCSQWMIDLRRQMARACQADVVRTLDGVDWSNYDFLFLQNLSSLVPFAKPPVPALMYGHDYHTHNYQPAFDWLQPEHFLSPCPTLWRSYWKIPPDTKQWFYPQGSSLFYTRSNLGEKQLDLLLVGATEPDSHYAARRQLTDQIRPLVGQYRIEFSHHLGWHGNLHTGPVESNGIRYLNKWSEYLGSAKYVAFGPDANRTLVKKYFEVLGSGAIPFLPDCHDLDLLGIEPGVHYIPLSEIWGDNKQVVHYLDNYIHHRHIAVNAVAWYRENVDAMLFDRFEDVVQEVTGHKYPRRSLK